MNVSRYLIHRFDQLGIRYLYGVPGNHLGPFLEVLAEERHAGRTQLEWVGTPTELGAGYAADGYARIHGIGAAAVTYGVGAFSLLNTIGGAYVEQVPLVAMVGSPTYEQWLNLRSIGLLTSHMSPRFESNLEVYRQVTVDAQTISNSALAPRQIDGALAACLSEGKPVYLEITENVFKGACAAPVGDIAATRRSSNSTVLGKAVAAAAKKFKASQHPIFWGGEEIDRLRLADDFQRLVDATGIPFCTTIGAKSILSENHPLFHGVYNGKASLPEVRRMFQEVADLRVGLGSWSTSKNLGGEVDLGEDWIVAAHEGVTVGSSFFPNVQLPDFVRELHKTLTKKPPKPAGKATLRAAAGAPARKTAAVDYYAIGAGEGIDVPKSREAFLASLALPAAKAPSGGARAKRGVAPAAAAAAPAAAVSPRLTYDRLFQRVNTFLAAADEGTGVGATNPYVVVSDAAFALLGSQNLRMVERQSFFAQNSWLAIGYSVGAVTGVKSARPGKRPLVFVGDGSFQETCQEMSTHTRLRHDTVLFVLDNEGFYGIEQMLVHPCFYAGQEPPAFYNILHRWSYSRLAEVFGSVATPMSGLVVRDERELEEALRRIGAAGDPINRGPILVQVVLAQNDYPAAIGYATDPCNP
ncbi:MAG TPA: thiamine pyrophosphate-binding protein [Thermoanaerobaculia bacterium]|nr:thiamine pyrophosphate-binding protein [Thermoanaerobaculia bacterium]